MRDNTLTQISGFQEFDQNTFVEESFKNLEDFEDTLVRAPELSFNWVLNSLNLVIFNINSIVDNHFDVLNIFHCNGQRAHRAFALPQSN